MQQEPPADMPPAEPATGASRQESAAGAPPPEPAAGALRQEPATGALRRAAAWAAGQLILFFARFITAVQPAWLGLDPGRGGQRIYLANHASHGDFILLSAVLPPRARARTRPVAGADYWDRGRFRRFIGREVFDALLIARGGAGRQADPVGEMAGALDAGASLILFPEGTRNLTEAPLLPLRSGIFHLARARPGVELVPVWIENLNRVLPKGAVIPVPLMCRVIFGAPLALGPDEPREAFLARLSAAMLALRPASPGAPLPELRETPGPMREPGSGPMPEPRTEPRPEPDPDLGPGLGPNTDPVRNPGPSPEARR